jgi:hypothetical protein
MMSIIVVVIKIVNASFRDVPSELSTVLLLDLLVRITFFLESKVSFVRIVQGKGGRTLNFLTKSKPSMYQKSQVINLACESRQEGRDLAA